MSPDTNIMWLLTTFAALHTSYQWHSFCKWEFVSQCLSAVSFLFHSPPSGKPCLFFLSITLFACCYIFFWSNFYFYYYFFFCRVTALLSWSLLSSVTDNFKWKIKLHWAILFFLYAEQKKRHRFIEQSFRLCGRRRGWDVSREQHRNMLLYF